MRFQRPRLHSQTHQARRQSHACPFWICTAASKEITKMESAAQIVKAKVAANMAIKKLRETKVEA